MIHRIKKMLISNRFHYSWALRPLVALSAGLVLLSFLSGCKTDEQAASEIFASGKLPPLLDQWTNPRPDNALTSKILAARAQRRNSRLPVGVIDTGTDYMHPGLLPQIEFRFDGNKIIGAGIDVLGEDNWASPRSFNAAIFAFGAEKIVEGKIVNPVQNPEALLLSINTTFWELFRQEQGSALESTLFAKINETNFSFFGAKYLVELLEAYKKEKGDLPFSNEVALKLPKKLNLPESTIKALTYFTWRMDETIGLPEPLLESITKPNVAGGTMGTVDFEFLAKLKGAEQFLTAMQKAVVLTENKINFQKLLTPYVDFQFARLQERKVEKIFRIERLQDLQKYLSKALQKNKSSSPFKYVVKRFCETQSIEVLEKLRNKNIPEKERLQLARKQFQETYHLFQQLYEYLQTTPDAFDDPRPLAKKNLSSFASYKPIFERYLAQQGWKAFLCEPDLATHDVFASAYLAHEKQNKNLFTSTSDSKNSHATHVAGIIAAQPPDISIFPVRVATNEYTSTKNRRQQILHKFSLEIPAWLQYEEAYAMATQKLAKNLRLKGFSNQEITQKSPEVIKYVAGVLRKHIAAPEKNNYLSAYFVLKLAEGIRALGRNQIKIANISLGEEFSKRPINKDALADEELADGLASLQMEYQKYLIGKAIVEDAQYTLFIAAAGNNGTWVEGRSRSAIPCDISTRSYLTKVNRKLPNNQIHNILCVGSIDPNDEISSFTNLTISDVPYVFSYGESILSSVKTSDCTGIEKNIRKKYGPAFQTYALHPDEPTSDSVLEKLKLLNRTEGKQLSEDKQTEQKQAAINELYTKLGILDSLHQTLIHHACATNLQHRYARMTGTSMASPAVAGYIGRAIVEKMNRQGLTHEEIYQHPEYAPRLLIDAVFAQSPQYGGRTILRNIPKITEIYPIQFQIQPMDTFFHSDLILK